MAPRLDGVYLQHVSLLGYYYARFARAEKENRAIVKGLSQTVDAEDSCYESSTNENKLAGVGLRQHKHPAGRN